MSQLSDAVRCAREDGYAQGKKDAVVYGRWMIRHTIHVDSYPFYKDIETPYDETTFNNPSGEIFCSECGTNALLNGAEEYVPSHFCHRCGANMDAQEGAEE